MTKKINFNEISYLKLTLLNYNENKIKEFLDLQENQLSQIVKSIKEKTGTKTIYEALIYCFRNNILNHKDYALNLIKDQSLNFSNQFIINERDITLFKSQNLIEFRMNCELIIGNEYNVDLRNIESNFLKLIVKGYDMSFIEKLLDVKNGTSKDLENIFFLKFNVTNWYNLLKIVVNLEEFNNKKLKDDLEVFSQKYVSTINSIIVSKLLTFKEKKEIIYLTLLDFFSDYDFKCINKLNI